MNAFVPERLSTTVRWLAFFVLMTLIAWMQASPAVAGCHYRTAKQHRAATPSHWTAAAGLESEDLNPHAHVRKFQFLGQWVYEGGQMKYVPWQADEPCHGPNCHADKDPLSDMHSLPDTHRTHSSLIFFSERPAQHDDDRTSAICLIDVAARTGYLHAHEYPP